MRLSITLDVLWRVCEFTRAALPPTIISLFRQPRLLLRPWSWSELFFSHLWNFCADPIDQNGRHVKSSLLKDAYGVVLDIGAGHGHTIQYVDRAKVTKYVALEPNVLMHDHIRAAATQAGFSESSHDLLILPFSAEDTTSIITALNESGVEHGVDTIVSVLTLCTVPSPQKVITSLVRDVLKTPGGLFLYYEHVRSDLYDVRWWQGFLTPIWRNVMIGCELNRPTDQWIDECDGWSEERTWRKEKEIVDNLLPHSVGRYVRV